MFQVRAITGVEIMKQKSSSVGSRTERKPARQECSRGEGRTVQSHKMEASTDLPYSEPLLYPIVYYFCNRILF